MSDRGPDQEVTPFRVFSTKDDLLTQAIVTRAEMDRDQVPEPTGQMEKDLEDLATMMVRVLAAGGHLLVRILPETRGLSEEQQAAVRQAFSETLETYAAVFRYYQSLGRLAPSIDDHISTIFVGPIMTAVLYAECWQQPVDSDVHQHAQSFLYGCGTEPRPPAPKTA